LIKLRKEIQIYFGKSIDEANMQVEVGWVDFGLKEKLSMEGMGNGQTWVLGKEEEKKPVKEFQ
jgi:hypothetical protein